MPVSSNLEPTLVALGLGAARTVPLCWSLPVFGGPAWPFGLRVAVGVGLAAVCHPFLATAPRAGAVALALLVVRELFIGLVMGLVCACVFRAAEAAGELADLTLGGTLEATTTPFGEHRSSPLGVLFLLLAGVVFLEMGGPAHVLSALVHSYEAFPLDVPLDLAPRAESAALLAIVAGAKLIVAAVGLAAPVLVALLLADVALALIGRVVPGVPLASVAVSVRTLAGVGVLLLALGALWAALQSAFVAFFALLESAIRAAR